MTENNFRVRSIQPKQVCETENFQEAKTKRYFHEKCFSREVFICVNGEE